jgi:uncharacterized phage protein (TIGR01671 family)
MLGVINNMQGNYRLWDTENNCYFKNVNEAWNGKLEQAYINMDGSICIRSMNHGVESFVHESVFPDRFVKEFSTGLSDKNGNEIYEGDIVTHETRTLGTYKGVVEYKIWQRGSGFEIKFVDNHSCGVRANQYEVIGNIHENPKLLKEL